MNVSPHVLIFGSAADLIATRRMVLEHAGLQVTVSLRLEEVAQLLDSERFDLFLLCHSLSLSECEGALQKARSVHPKTAILVLGTALSACAGSGNDATLTAFASPQALIAKVKDLTGVPANT